FTNGAFQIHPFILISPCLLSGQIHLLTEIYATGGLTWQYPPARIFPSRETMAAKLLAI
ncbi:MAG: hypothetical protein ACI909_002652, partial [Planctomycetota bacterium]